MYSTIQHDFCVSFPSIAAQPSQYRRVSGVSLLTGTVLTGDFQLNVPVVVMVMAAVENANI